MLIVVGKPLDYLGKSNRRMCGLLFPLVDVLGVRLVEFSDSRDRLPDVSAIS